MWSNTGDHVTITGVSFTALIKLVDYMESQVPIIYGPTIRVHQVRIKTLQFQITDVTTETYQHKGLYTVAVLQRV